MNKLLSFLLLITLISCSTEEQSTKEDLYFRFEINDSTHLDIKANLQANSFQIKNGIEKIEMKEYVSFNDHFSARFPVFESYIMAKKKVVNTQVTTLIPPEKVLIKFHSQVSSSLSLVTQNKKSHGNTTSDSLQKRLTNSKV